MEYSQWCQDLLGLLMFFFIALPFVAGLLFLCISLVVIEVKSNELKREYEKTLSEYDRNVIYEYFEHTRYHFSRNKKKNEKKDD